MSDTIPKTYPECWACSKRLNCKVSKDMRHYKLYCPEYDIDESDYKKFQEDKTK